MALLRRLRTAAILVSAVLAVPVAPVGGDDSSAPGENAADPVARPAGQDSAGANVDAAALSLRILTFNVRVGYIPEGTRGWNYRRPLVAGVVSRTRPDLVGTQECTGIQVQDLLADLPGYRTIGKPRRGGELLGLMNVLFYRPEVLEPGERGVFWMSETPDQPGGKGWGNENPRTAVWCRFRTRADGRELLVVNTHLDHASPESRDRSGPLLVARARELARDAPVIVTGDFNCTAGSVAHSAMTGEEAEGGLGLIDVLAALDPEAESRGTYHGYTGQSTRRIDFVFASRHLAPVLGEVVRDGGNGHWPSDHFPVLTELSWER